MFIVGSSLISIIIPIVSWGSFENWFTTSIAVSVFVYYVFIVQQLTKKDVMTGLLNRQSYYADLEKTGDISAFISLDMNGLKKLNDTEGHLAGDVALTTLADCFTKAAGFGQRIYRVGGDEFMIVCRRCSEDAVKELISKINANVSQTIYQCSIGYCMYEPGMSLDELYNKADDNMYKQKQEFYKRHSEMDRRKNR